MAPIILAHEERFAIGRTNVIPSVRTVRSADRQEIVEPRVMQVLVALAKAEGAVLSRDDLVAACWDGRIVGDDAINRVMSRLRRLADGIGAHSFVIETVTRVGYRLRALDGVGAGREDRVIPPAGGGLSRRTALVGVAVAAVAVAVGVGIAARRDGQRISPRVAALMEQARLSLSQANREGQSQAIALYRQAVELEPRNAEAWGALGTTYALVAHYRPQRESEVLRRLARAAGERALALDRGNAEGTMAVAGARPRMGNWFLIERTLSGVVDRHPGNQHALFELGLIAGAAGRNADSARWFDRLYEIATPTPWLAYARIMALWGANRMEDTDAAIAEASRLYPTHFAIWFASYYILLSSGRAGAAIAMGENLSGRPSGIPRSEFEAILAIARAANSRDPAQIDAALDFQQDGAREGTGKAENAAQFAALLGRPDVAFAILDAYYFDGGFRIPEVRFTPEQGTYTPRDDRLTAFLFNPIMAPFHSNPRFANIVRKLGLEDYWRASGSHPDFRQRLR